MLGETLGLCEAEAQKLPLSVPDTLTLEEEECEGLKEPVIVGLGLSVAEAVLVRQSEGLPLTVEVGLKEADAQKLPLSVPDTLTLEEEECEGLKEPVMVGLELSVADAVIVRQSEGLPLTVEVGLKVDDAQ